MRGFIVVEDSFPMQVGAVADAITMIFRLRGVNGTAAWYFDDDDCDRPTEYGVKMDINGLSPEQAIDQMRSIWQLCVAQFEDREVRLEIPQQ